MELPNYDSRAVRYFTVIVPWSDTPTEWHPTDKGFCPLTRGSFKSEIAARIWACKHLGGQAYWLACIEWGDSLGGNLRRVSLNPSSNGKDLCL